MCECYSEDLVTIRSICTVRVPYILMVWDLSSFWAQLHALAATTILSSGVDVGWVPNNESEPFSFNDKTANQETQGACDWWNLTDGVAYKSTLCSNTAMFRYSASTSSFGLHRATLCAHQTGESCVLSHEVGTHIPGVYVYDHTQETPGMRLLAAPRILGTETHSAGPEATHPSQHHVRITTPLNGNSRVIDMFKDIQVEYFDHATHAVRHLNMSGNDAFCVQSLHLSVGPKCTQLYE